MKRIILFSLVSLFVLLTGCFDDKGNYDYHDLDEITVKFPGNVGTDENIILMGKLQEPLDIQPEVTYGEPQNLKYSWERYTENKETEVLSNTKDLKYDKIVSDSAHITWQVGTYNLKYTVTDTVSHQSLEKLVSLTIRSITPVGVYVLYGDENSSDVGTIENSDFTQGLENADQKLGYYSQKFGKEMDGKGIAIHWYGARNGDLYRGMFIFTDKTGTNINTTDFSENVSYKKMFYLWNRPQYAPKLAGNNEFVMDDYSATLYATLQNGNEQIFEGMIDQFYDEDPNYRGNMMPSSDPMKPLFKSGAISPDLPGAGELGYDPVQHIFVQSGWNGLPLDPDENPSAFDPSNLGNGSLIGIDFSQYNNYGWNKWAIYKTADDKLVAYHFNNSPDEGKSRFDIKQVIANSDVNPELLNTNCFSMSTITDGIGYFSTPEKVYAMDVINDPESMSEIFTPDAGEEITNIRLLKVGIDDDDVKILNNYFREKENKALYVVTRKGDQGFVYRVPVTTEGNIDNSQEVQKWEGFGIIRCLTFRLE